jgi:hypothetical protein
MGQHPSGRHVRARFLDRRRILRRFRFIVIRGGQSRPHQGIMAIPQKFQEPFSGVRLLLG